MINGYVVKPTRVSSRVRVDWGLPVVGVVDVDVARNPFRSVLRPFQLQTGAKDGAPRWRFEEMRTVFEMCAVLLWNFR